MSQSVNANTDGKAVKFEEKKVWRLGIRVSRHGEPQNWRWSNEFPSFKACATAYADWIDAHPKTVFRFDCRVSYVKIDDNPLPTPFPAVNDEPF